MLLVKYKYAIQAQINEKPLNRFLDDFFEKHFEEFLIGEVMLVISRDVGRLKMLYFDIDFDLMGNKYPEAKAREFYDNLLELFYPNNFLIEMTPNGYHIVSNFLYESVISEEQIKQYFKKRFQKGYNIDYAVSFSINPMLRLGYNREKGFFYCPVFEFGGKIRRKMETHDATKIYPREFWEIYIKQKLIPTKAKIKIEKYIGR